MRRLLAVIFCFVIVFSIIGCKKSVEWNGKTEILADMMMAEDVTDRYYMVGMADHVFIGTVEKIERSVISKKADYEDCFSIYEIRVVQNLKGELKENIVCSKFGGFSSDGTMLLARLELPDGRTMIDTGLPKEGKTYIFIVYTQPDGSLRLSELFDDRECTDELIMEYKEYVENETPCERERFISDYERTN